MRKIIEIYCALIQFILGNNCAREQVREKLFIMRIDARINSKKYRSHCITISFLLGLIGSENLEQ